MTSKHDFTEHWQEKSPEERRARLNELGRITALGNPHSEDEKREHDALATLVAEDEK